MKKYVIGLLLSGMMPLVHAFPMSDNTAGSHLMASLDLSDSALDEDSRSDCMLRLSESMFEINRSAGSSCGGMPWVYEIDEDARLSVSNGAGGGESGVGAGDADVQDFDSSLFGSVGSGSYLETGSESSQQSENADSNAVNEQGLIVNRPEPGQPSRQAANTVGSLQSSLSASSVQPASSGFNAVGQSAGQMSSRSLKLASTSSVVPTASVVSSISIASGSSISSQAPASSGSVALPGRPTAPAVSASVDMSSPSGVPAPSVSSASIPAVSEHSVISTASLTGLTAADMLSVIDPLSAKAEAMTQSPYAPSTVAEPYSLLLLFAGLGLLSLQRKNKPQLILVQA